MSTNIDMNKIQRINFTLNPKNDFDYEVIEAIEKLKEEGYNVSARIKKLLINDANNIITTTAATTNSVEVVAKEKSFNNEIVSDNDDEEMNTDGFDVDIDLSDMPM